MSSEADRSAPHANTLTNPCLPRAGTQVFQDPGGHVTGVSWSNPLEPMPPILIYNTNSKSNKNTQINPSLVHRLPEIVG